MVSKFNTLGDLGRALKTRADRQKRRGAQSQSDNGERAAVKTAHNASSADQPYRDSAGRRIWFPEDTELKKSKEQNDFECEIPLNSEDNWNLSETRELRIDLAIKNMLDDQTNYLAGKRPSASVNTVRGGLPSLGKKR